MIKIYLTAYGPNLWPVTIELKSPNEDFTDCVELLKLEGYDAFKLRRAHA